LHGVEASKALEQLQAAPLPRHALMQRAGLSVARLAMAIAPHADRVWVACGPGNNGGDGLEAALHLKRFGKSVSVTWFGAEDRCPPDTQEAWRRARIAGVDIGSPDDLESMQSHAASATLCVDALLGIGSDLRSRPLGSALGQCMALLNQARDRHVPVLAVDIPTGLESDTGHVPALAVSASHTLSLLTLKPGLFTGMGRDQAGEIWFDDLTREGDAEINPSSTLAAKATAIAPCGLLTAPPAHTARLHATHKGSYGQVNLIGGANGMVGAALLAARAAQRIGAGKVFVGLLDDQGVPCDPSHPELMFRRPADLDLRQGCTVVGCGGGSTPQHAQWLARAASAAPQLVVDADGLNLLAADAQLQALVRARCSRQFDGLPWMTVLTPHPLEAARLLGINTAQVQQDRMSAACALADRYRAVLVLKGSGSIVAAPQTSSEPPHPNGSRAPVFINSTGDARLATAGSGDVLAGMLGGSLCVASANAVPLQLRVAQVVWLHGNLPQQAAQRQLGNTASGFLEAIQAI
jgi:ADP-dependent NAD(P)H-hydrate dehydratase / NAD(P)H-hydrate epimerase